jgi:hypothetical protein
MAADALAVAQKGCVNGLVNFTITATVSQAGSYVITVDGVTDTVRLKAGANSGAFTFRTGRAGTVSATIKKGTSTLATASFAVTAAQARACRPAAATGPTLAQTGGGQLTALLLLTAIGGALMVILGGALLFRRHS